MPPVAERTNAYSTKLKMRGKKERGIIVGFGKGKEKRRGRERRREKKKEEEEIVRARL